MKTDTPIKCPTCGGDCRIEWSGLDLVENSGDETLATKQYISIADQQNKEMRESMDRGIEASQRMVEGELLEKDAEIQRLTKELEELKRPLGNSAHPLEDRLIEQAKQEAKNWKNPECFIGGFGWGCAAADQLKDQELTSLRELLDKRSTSCQCGQNSLPYSANYTVETCSRCGMPCKSPTH